MPDIWKGICVIALLTVTQGCQSKELTRDKVETALSDWKTLRCWFVTQRAWAMNPENMLVANQYATLDSRYKLILSDKANAFNPKYENHDVAGSGMAHEIIAMDCGQVAGVSVTGIKETYQSSIKIAEIVLSVVPNELGSIGGVSNEIKMTTTFEQYDDGWRERSYKFEDFNPGSGYKEKNAAYLSVSQQESFLVERVERSETYSKSNTENDRFSKAVEKASIILPNAEIAAFWKSIKEADAEDWIVFTVQGPGFKTQEPTERNITLKIGENKGSIHEKLVELGIVVYEKGGDMVWQEPYSTKAPSWNIGKEFDFYSDIPVKFIKHHIR